MTPDDDRLTLREALILGGIGIALLALLGGMQDPRLGLAVLAQGVGLGLGCWRGMASEID